MVHQCSVNSITIWSPLLSQVFQEAKRDPKVLTMLQNLQVVIATGAPLPAGDLVWATENGLRIVNYFGLTEVGGLMYTLPPKTAGDPAPHLFRPVPGTGAILVPAEGVSEPQSAKLVEIVVPSDSPLFPGPSFASLADGHFHTGDFFEEIIPGRYEYRGRTDDWIKMSNATRCNTKAIEDHIRSSCGHLISECVVVGSGRVCPAILVERNPLFKGDDEVVRREIVSLSAEFNSRRYTNEQVPDERLIFIVKKDELPRTATKGNVRRRAVEDKYRQVLDDAYATLT